MPFALLDAPFPLHGDGKLTSLHACESSRAACRMQPQPTTAIAPALLALGQIFVYDDARSAPRRCTQEHFVEHETWVIFDLGGVLVDCVGGWAEACNRANVPLRPISQNQWESSRELFHAFETGAIDEPSFILRLAQSLDLSPTHIAAILDAWLLGPKNGAAAIIERLRARGVPTAVLSNTNPRHWNTLEQNDAYLPLRQLTPRFASHQLGLRKPDPLIWSHVQEQLAVTADRILFFDDLEDNIRAARASGWNTVWVNSPAPIAQIERELLEHGLLF
ncbi:MAG: HAD family phosphatase [Myxococcota bacterium]|nr:HAD family phosphatase [Myxococcota bacterium]